MWRDAEDGTPLCNACGIRCVMQMEFILDYQTQGTLFHLLAVICWHGYIFLAAQKNPNEDVITPESILIMTLIFSFLACFFMGFIIFERMHPLLSTILAS